jgi:hypothetical protein
MPDGVHYNIPAGQLQLLSALSLASVALDFNEESG